MFHLRFRITFGGRPAHLAYQVHKSGRKTSIIIIIIIIILERQPMSANRMASNISVSNGNGRGGKKGDPAHRHYTMLLDIFGVTLIPIRTHLAAITATTPPWLFTGIRLMKSADHVTGCAARSIRRGSPVCHGQQKSRARNGDPDLLQIFTNIVECCY